MSQLAVSQTISDSITIEATQVSNSTINITTEIEEIENNEVNNNSNESSNNSTTEEEQEVSIANSTEEVETTLTRTYTISDDLTVTQSTPVSTIANLQ